MLFHNELHLFNNITTNGNKHVNKINILKVMRVLSYMCELRNVASELLETIK